MKSLFVILVLSFSLNLQMNAQAEFELSTNPIFLLIPETGIIPLSLEAIVNADWGAGMDAAIGTSGGGYIYASAKHYFNPEKGGDKFYLGLFAGGANFLDEVGYGLGFMAGYKWMSQSGITFELAGGLGRDFTGNVGFLPYGKLNVGYRFGYKKKAD
jgi:hypothetical protein